MRNPNLSIRYIGATNRVAAAVMLCALTAGCLTAGCSLSSNEDTIESWQNSRHRAFESFRDNRFDDAVTRYKEAVALAKKLGPVNKRLPVTLNDLGRTYAAQGRYNEAAATYNEAISLFNALNERGNVKTDGLDMVVGWIDALEGMALACEKSGRIQEADEYFKQALSVLSMNDQPTRKRDIVYLYRNFLNTHGRSAEAHQLDKTAGEGVEADAPLPDEQDSYRERFSKLMRSSLTNLGAGKTEESFNETVLACDVAAHLKDKTRLADAQTQLAVLYFGKRNNAQALKQFQMAMANYDSQQVADTKRLNCLVGYSRGLMAIFHYAEAEPIARRAVAAAIADHDKEEHEVADACGLLATLCYKLNKYDEAVDLQRKAFETVHRHAPLGRTDTVMSACYLTNMLYMCHRGMAGKKFLQGFTGALKKLKPDETVLAARLFTDFGTFCMTQQQKEEGIELFNSALDLLKRTPNQKTEIARAQQQLKAAQSKQT